MENIFFLIIISFLPLVLLSLFADGDFSSPQPQSGSPQMGQQKGNSPGSLNSYSLPAGAVTENDISGIKTLIQQVLDKISEPVKTAGEKADHQTIKSGILTFQDWLRAQGCVSRASSTYDIEKTDKYSENIFMTHPGQLPFDISFKVQGGMEKPYRLLIFINPAYLFHFGSLVENKSVGGIPVPEKWPKDTWSYWENRT